MAVWLLWLLLWQLTAFFVNNPIYFAGPYDTASELITQAKTPDFWLSVSHSLLRIAGGFFLASMSGYVLSFISLRFKAVGEIISPVILFLKSVPVAAVTVILLIWWGSRMLVICISFMVVFPNVYRSMLKGLESTDKEYLEMAKVFRISPLNKLIWIYRPFYLPQLSSALFFSLGLAFKSGIAAEIIGLPKNSIGERLYRDKIYLNTAGVFGWIVAVLILSSLSELLLKGLLRLSLRFPSPVSNKGYEKGADNAYDLKENICAPKTLRLSGIKKSYGERQILNTDITLESGKIYHLSAPSGTGKTTLLKVILGLLESDGESALNTKGQRFSAVFQEDRLLPDLGAVRNLSIAGCKGDIKAELLDILPKDALERTAGSMSGGEKRRLSIARAMLSPSQIILMDEPFTGLDDEMKSRMIGYILKRRLGRTLFIVSHDDTDAAILGAVKLVLRDGQINEMQK